jgi:hypothetical protein
VEEISFRDYYRFERDKELMRVYRVLLPLTAAALPRKGLRQAL